MGLITNGQPGLGGHPSPCHGPVSPWGGTGILCQGDKSVPAIPAAGRDPSAHPKAPAGDGTWESSAQQSPGPDPLARAGRVGAGLRVNEGKSAVKLRHSSWIMDCQGKSLPGLLDPSAQPRSWRVSVGRAGFAAGKEEDGGKIMSVFQ